MNQQTNWYVIYTKPRWEKKVAELLTRKSIVNYCPLNKVQRQWHDRKKIILEPLFTSYVFVKADMNQHTIISETSGIINFVYWLGKPALVKNEEIETIKQFVEEYQNVRLEKTQVNVNDRIKIIHGPLMNREGNVIEILSRSVKVTLPSLGYALVAQVDKSNIERIEVFRNPHLAEPYKMIN